MFLPTQCCVSPSSLFEKLPNFLHFAIGLLLISFVRDMRLVGAVEIPVCCPAGHVLVDINQGFFRSEKYECMVKGGTTSNGTRIQASWEFVETDLIHGFRIREVATSSVPRCENQMLVKLNEETQLAARSCLIKLYGTMFAISCPLEDQDVLQKVSVIRKCCPFGYVYESGLKKCIAKNFPLSYYEVFFDHPVVLNDEHLGCKSSHVVVEYKLRYDEFKFSDGYLILKATNQRFDNDEFCVEGVVNSSAVIEQKNMENFKGSLRFLVRVCDTEDVCDRIPCIRKCCNDGEIYVRGNRTSYCVADTTDVSYHSFESLEFTGNFSKPSVFGIHRGLECKKYKLTPDPDYPDDDHNISDDDGSVFLPYIRKTYDNTNYCVEKIRNASTGPQKLYTFLCFEDLGKDAIKFNLYSIGLLISSVFYALTLLVYLCIPKLRNLPGKILICLVISLFAAYMGIAIGQIRPPNDNICFTYAFFIYFSLIAAFAWMNVMCFDIWQTFGSAERAQGMKRGQRKKFIFYSMYGWGLPSLLTAITICLTKFNVLSDSIRPKFGQGRCWFQHTLAASQLLFFSGPVGILFLVNFVLFILTLRYCNKVKREIFRMQSSNTEKPILRKRFFMDKARFMMNTKLFMVMGITWFLEILSIVFYNRKRTFFWVISDSFNVLLGVIVFFVFVFKKRVWQAILVRLGIKAKESLKTGGPGTYATNSTYACSVNLQRLRSMESNSSLLTPSAAARRQPSFTTA